jgi:hypothetical protein
VNSVSAPNGVGKSSIFDALAFAIRGSISKLDDLPAAESGGDYYVNKFHSSGEGTVSLTVKPIAAGASVTVAVKRDIAGNRVVTSSPGVDGTALLASLDRDFVLLDHKTLQSFMDHKALDRGRSFAGLLGLAKYSTLRQELEALANTRAFNRYFSTHDLQCPHANRLGRPGRRYRCDHGRTQRAAPDGHYP